MYCMIVGIFPLRMLAAILAMEGVAHVEPNQVCVELIAVKLATGSSFVGLIV